MEIYLVGGAVRDKLLDYPCHERDWLVVGGTPEEMINLGYDPVGSDFPVFLHPETKEEYALARTERKSGVGYKGFQFNTDPAVTLEQDLLRRDLTINAMAMDAEGNLFDPYHGQRDLADKLLRHVSSAFVEDPLRVLRVARFAARYHHLGFRVASDTLSLMRELCDSRELQELTPERVWLETERALGERSPRIYIEVLRECGALGVLFPEVDRLFGVPQRKDFHPEVDTGLHVLMSLEMAAKLSSDSCIRFAVLMHDLGKGTTPQEILPRHIGHEERGVPLVRDVCKRYRVPNRFRDLAIATSRYHLLCHKSPYLRPITTMKLLKGLDAFRRPDRFQQFLICCEADARGRTGFEDTEYESGKWLAETFQLLRNVDNRRFIDAGMRDRDIGRAVEKQRLEIIANRRLEAA